MECVERAVDGSWDHDHDTEHVQMEHQYGASSEAAKHPG